MTLTGSLRGPDPAALEPRVFTYSIQCTLAKAPLKKGTVSAANRSVVNWRWQFVCKVLPEMELQGS